jgi:hypothetical protein
MVRHKHLLGLACLVIVLLPVKTQNYQCAICPVGKYKSLTTNSNCVSCPQNTYQPVLGATSATACNPCPTNSYSAVGSSSLAACGCAAGYSGDVANYSLGVWSENLAAACTGACVTTSSRNLMSAANAIDLNVATSSWSDVVVSGDLPFSGMTPWWKVRFEREAVVQSVVIQNEDTTRLLSNFYIRVGTDDTISNMNTQTLCAGPLTWPAGYKTYTFACAAAVRGRYLYIINGANAALLLTEVTVKGYLAPATDACVVCPAGSYKAASGPGTCTACAAGQASAVVGSTSASTCTNCPAGTYAGAAAAVCVGCPSNTYSYVNSQSISSCTCNKGYTPLPNVVNCNAFQTLYLSKKPWADYRATAWGTDKTLIDQSGNGRNSLTGSDTVTQGTTTTTVNGASPQLTYIKGGVGTKVFFPTASIYSQFTICSVTRYAAPAVLNAPTNYKRIVGAVGHDWLHGHVEQKRGIAYYGSRAVTNPQTLVVTPLTFNTLVQNVGTQTDWLVMCSKNGGSTPFNVLVDGVPSGTSTRSDSDQNEWGNVTMDRATQLCINCRVNEESDWEMTNLLIWNSHLNDTEMNLVSEELRKQLRTSEPLNSVCTQTPSSNCSACVPGKYKSSQGPDVCTDCVSGKYLAGSNADSASYCLPCQLNTDAPASSTAPTDCKCLAGYSGATDGQACAACVAGSYKTSTGTGTCTQCAANMYSTIGAQTTSTCQSCPLNSKSPAGSDEASDCVCDAGYTGANGAACLPCVSGTYKTAPGAQVCTMCGNNTYSSAVAATAAGTCAPCQQNSISVMGSDEWSDCKCLSGYLTNDIGRVNATCSQCVAGSYNPTLGATTCSKCAGGFKSSSPGAVAVEQCLACPANTYSAPGAANCDTCPTGTFAPAPSVQLTDCKCLAGYYATNGQDGSTCQVCPAGTFKPLTGAAACTVCPADKYSTATAATSNATCLPCTQNAVAPVGSSASSMCLCNFGYKTFTVDPGDISRSCGANSNQACPCTQSSTMWSNTPCENALDGNDNTESFTNGNLGTTSWFRIDLMQQVTVSAFEVRFVQYDQVPRQVDIKVRVGNVDSYSSTANALCFENIGSLESFAPKVNGWTRRFSCVTPVTGQYIFYILPYNSPNSNFVTFGRFSTYGIIGSPTISCIGCIAGTYKDTLGSAACTNCPADTYSDAIAARNASTCTRCYNNAFTAAGSASIMDCGCSSGYEFVP